MNPLKLGFDLDGVFADFNTAFVKLIAEQTGIILPAPGDDYPKVWNYHIEDGKLTQAEQDKVFNVIANTRFWAELNAYSGAMQTLETLNDLSTDHDVVFITCRRGERAKELSRQWLRWFGIDDPTVIIECSKGPVAKELQLDFFVDDKPENVEEVALAGVNWVYLVDRPYNRNYDNDRDLVLRVASPGQALEHFLNGVSFRNVA